jgi:hypothetical protein
MKAIAINILCAVIWSFLGHYLGIISHFFSFIYFPFLFIVSAYFIKFKLNSVIVIPFCYSLIVLNDYLFRIFGGGIHDDVGKGLCDLIFNITILTTTISMFFVAYKITQSKIQRFYNSLLVIVFAAGSYLFYLKFRSGF